jgi:Flp pilus assembly protein TadG
VKRFLSFRRDQSGVSALEFALIAPALLGMLVGITQLGALYFARADLRSAVAMGARQAQIFPRPTSAVMVERIRAKMVRLDQSKLTAVTVTITDTGVTYPFADIEVRYAVPLNFIIYKPPPVTLIERRRVFVQPAA